MSKCLFYRKFCQNLSHKLRIICRTKWKNHVILHCYIKWTSIEEIGSLWLLLLETDDKQEQIAMLFSKVRFLPQSASRLSDLIHPPPQPHPSAASNGSGCGPALDLVRWINCYGLIGEGPLGVYWIVCQLSILFKVIGGGNTITFLPLSQVSLLSWKLPQQGHPSAIVLRHRSSEKMSEDNFELSLMFASEP